MADVDSRLVTAALTPAILFSAAQLTTVHDLRAYDAVQLASALAVRRADPDCATLAACDVKLREAAAVQRLALLPATLPA